MRLIDANELKVDYIDSERSIEAARFGLEAFHTIKAVSIDQINSAPSIEIIRCKECKHSNISFNEDCVYCEELMWTMKPDDFCSYGERSEV